MAYKCRCCLTLSPKLQYYSLLTIFPEFERNSLSVLDLLSLVTSTEIKLSNDFPSTICSECFKSLKLAYNFIVAFQTSQQILLKYDIQEDNGASLKTQEWDNENLEEILDSNEENIIIITEENENVIFEHSDNMSNADNTVDLENVETNYIKIEDNLLGSISSGPFDDYSENELNKESDMSEDDHDDNIKEIDDSDSEDTEEQNIIFNDVVDQQIIQMENKIRDEIKSKPPQNFKCQFCDKAYALQRTLLIHIKRKHHESDPEYTPKIQENKQKRGDELEGSRCDICDKVFKTKTYLQVHKKNFHRPNETFECDICHEVFQNRCAIRYHKLAKHEGKQVKCSQCEKKFISTSTLKQHIIAVHDKTLPNNYLCSICGRGFKYTTALKYHMGKVHTNEREFICRYCGAAFILVGELRSHERNHTGVRPYSCKHCKKTFKRNSQKTNHEKTHDGIYPYTCKYCYKKFFTSTYNMKVHWLQHRGDFGCDICPKGFASEEILKFHYKYHHKKKKIFIKEEIE